LRHVLAAFTLILAFASVPSMASAQSCVGCQPGASGFGSRLSFGRGAAVYSPYNQPYPASHYAHYGSVGGFLPQPPYDPSVFAVRAVTQPVTPPPAVPTNAYNLSDCSGQNWYDVDSANLVKWVAFRNAQLVAAGYCVGPVPVTPPTPPVVVTPPVPPVPMTCPCKCSDCICHKTSSGK
jgi:hypothetical protein